MPSTNIVKYLWRKIFKENKGNVYTQNIKQPLVNT